MPAAALSTRWRVTFASALVAVLLSSTGPGRVEAVAGTGRAEAIAGADQADLRARRSVADLSAAERRAFVDAVLALKETPSPYGTGLSWYDQFVAWHVTLSHCDASDPLSDHQQRGHAGPMFLPWHRQFVLLFEDALRTVSGSDVTVPYWDWTDPASTAAVFSEDFMGGDGDPLQGYAVTDGPFRRGRWTLEVRNHGLSYGTSASDHLVRHLGSFPGAPLPTDAEVERALAVEHFDVAPFDDSSDPSRSFRNALEGWRTSLPVPLSGTGCLPTGELVTAPIGGFALHNAIHLWVGGIAGVGPTGTPLLGTMSVPQASPNDPVFFLHHANIDRLWAKWQAVHGAATYAPGSSASGNGADDLIEPFAGFGENATPASLAEVVALGYRYVEASSYCRLAAAPAADDGAPGALLAERLLDGRRAERSTG